MNPTANLLKTRRQKFGVLSLLLMLLVGGVFIVVGFLTIGSGRIDSTWTKVSGEVVSSTSQQSDNSTIYAPIVEYKVNGQSYRVTSGVSTSSSPTIGETREVAYNPTQPNQAKLIETGFSAWFIYLFPALGVLMVVLGPVLFVRSLKRGDTITKLRQSGQKIQGIVSNIQSSNSQGAFKIVVSATDMSGAVQHYTSDSLNGIGALAMFDYQTNPVPVDVYIDPANPKHYYVDVDDIPNLTAERLNGLVQSAVNKPQVSPTPNDVASPQVPQAPTPPNPPIPPIPPIAG